MLVVVFTMSLCQSVIPFLSSKVIVHKSGGGNYFIEDKEKDVKHIVKVKRLSLILTFLGKKL